MYWNRIADPFRKQFQQRARLPGVQLGDDVIVGAGAVVTKSYPSGSVIAGVPAKLIATYSTEAVNKLKRMFF